MPTPQTRSAKLERRARMLNGLPRKVDATRSFGDRLVHNHWVWLFGASLIGYGVLLWFNYVFIRGYLIDAIAKATTKAGRPVVLSVDQFNEALGQCTGLAAWTLLFYVVVFVLIDRLRPTTWSMKIFALCWGAIVGFYVGLHTNEWVGRMIGREDPVAVFVAPFVEEFSKATVLFVLAILVRYRIVSALQSVTLAGLSAVGFAFTENVLYYIQIYLQATNIISDGRPDEALRHIAITRGVLLSWGHPLFTSMTAIGLAVALTNRSKLVRIVAPLAGFCFAVFGHMTFNSLASNSAMSITMMLIIGLSMVLAMVAFLWRRFRIETNQVAQRLSDYVREGWLRPRDAVVFASPARRAKLAFAGLLRGPRVFAATLRLERDMSELAYLRAAETRGVVDESGLDRARELLQEIRQLRAVGLDETQGLRIKPDNWQLPKWARLRRRQALPQWAPSGPPTSGPATLPAQQWAPPSTAPVGVPAGSRR